MNHQMRMNAAYLSPTLQSTKGNGGNRERERERKAEIVEKRTGFSLSLSNKCVCHFTSHNFSSSKNLNEGRIYFRPKIHDTNECHVIRMRFSLSLIIIVLHSFELHFPENPIFAIRCVCVPVHGNCFSMCNLRGARALPYFEI